MNLKDYFSFTRTEKRGVLFLLSLIIVLITGTPFIKYLITSEFTDFSKFDAAISTFEKDLKNQQKVDSLNRFSKKSIKLPSALFKFNPNEIENSKWVKLGLKEWQIKTINNYKSKGGRFRVKSDVKKIYGMSDNLFALLYPYIQLPEEIKYDNQQKNNSTNSFDSKSFSKPDKFLEKPKYSYPIDINTCDTNGLKSLKGIGSSFSKRIIKYRESLGGFVKLEQLKEVYGITDEIYNQIVPNITIINKQPIKLNINNADLELLKKHPYIGWNLAKTIIAYRNSHGKYNQIEDVKKIHLVTDEIYSKIVPYLTIN